MRGGINISTLEERIEIFQDTINWIENDLELSASVALAKLKTTVFYIDDYQVFDMANSKDTVVTVTGDRSYRAVMRLYKENPKAKIAVMNFANASYMPLDLILDQRHGVQGAF